MHLLRQLLVSCPANNLQNVGKKYHKNLNAMIAFCHFREGGNPDIVPAQAGNQKELDSLDSRFRGSDGLSTRRAVIIYCKLYLRHTTR
jgi:hypothetical protein